MEDDSRCAAPIPLPSLSPPLLAIHGCHPGASFARSGHREAADVGGAEARGSCSRRRLLPHSRSGGEVKREKEGEDAEKRCEVMGESGMKNK